MSNFKFMPIRDGRNWEERIYHGYKMVETSINDWYFDEIQPFQRRPHHQAYTGSIKRHIERFINHTLYPDIHAMLSDNNGYTVTWTYEDICEYLHEPMLLEGGYGDKLKYFLGKFDARYLEHIEKISKLLRYIDLYGWSGIFKKVFKKGVEYYSDYDQNITREEAENILNSKLTELWNSTDFSNVLTGTPGNRSSGRVDYNYDKTVDRFNGVLSETVIQPAVNPTSRGIFHTYCRFHEINWDSESVINTGGLYPGVPQIPDTNKFYHLFAIEINDISPDIKFLQKIGSGEIPPPVHLPEYPETASGSPVYKYTIYAGFDRMAGVYDIKPDEPDTFLT